MKRVLLFGSASVLAVTAAQAQTVLNPYRAQVGTTAGTLAAGNDPRITGALQATNNLSDLVNPANARVSLGLGSMAVQNAASVAISGGSVGALTLGNGGDPSFDATGVRVDTGGLSVANPLLYGYGNTAVGCSVIGNGEGGGRAQVMGGFTTPSGVATYADRDAVGCYFGIYNRPPYLPGVTATGFTTSSVTLAAPVDTTKLRVNMLIDTSDQPKFTGIISGWSSDGMTINVSGWYQQGNTVPGQVPAGTTLDINPNTKVWAINGNVDMYANGEAKRATALELGINNYTGADDTTNGLWGMDVVNLGANAAGSGYLARGRLENAFVAGEGNGFTGSNAGFLYNPGASGYGAALLSYAPGGALFDAYTSARGHVLTGDSATGAIDMGAYGVVGTSSQPALRFHTTGGNNAYDAEILPSGGTAGTPGAAALAFLAGSDQFTLNAAQGLQIAPSGPGAVQVSVPTAQSLVLAAGNGGIVATTGGLAVNGGQIELGNPTASLGSVPYLDMHYGTGSAQDYNVRIANDGDGQLTLLSTAGQMARFTAAGLMVPNITLGPQAANMVLVGPVSGAAASPAFRPLAAADLPPSVLLAGTRSVAIRATWPLYPASLPTRTSATYRQYYQAAARAPISALKLRYSDAVAIAGGEADGTSPITITAAIETNPASPAGPWPVGSASAAIYPVTFNNGARSITITPGAMAESDPVWLPLGATQSFYVRTYVSVPTGGTWPGSQGLNPALFEAGNDGGFDTQLVTADGLHTGFSGTLSGGDVVLPLIANSLRFYGSGIVGTVTDDGTGNLVGTGVAGSINYTTGAWSLSFTTAPPAGAIYVAGEGRGGTVAGDETMAASPNDFSTHLAQWTSYLGSYAPAAILGFTAASGTAQESVCLIGDGNLAGADNPAELLGYPGYAVGQKMGVISIATPGDSAQALRSGNYRRLALLARSCDRVLGNDASNDAVAGRSLTQIEADLTALWQQLASMLPHGYRDITWQAMLPRTSSANSSTPYQSNAAIWGSGTVASGNPSLRNAFNSWLCGQVGVTIGAVLDLNTLVENHPGTCSGSGSGVWQAASDTLDGTRLSESTEMSLIPAAFGVAGSTPAPVFTP